MEGYLQCYLCKDSMRGSVATLITPPKEKDVRWVHDVCLKRYLRAYPKHPVPTKMESLD